MFARGDAAAQTSDRAWLQAMLDFEAELARACASVGLVPSEAAEAIAAACDASLYDVGEIGREAAASGTPVMPMLERLRARVGGDFAKHVHVGATSQDVIDTAAILVLTRTLPAISADAIAAADLCAGLAERHRDTPIIGRTLLQQAMPTTFGLKAAGWLADLDLAGGRLAEAAIDLSEVQLGGAVGNLAVFGEHGQAVATAVADALGLPPPLAPWHTQRARIVVLGDMLALLTGVLGKIGRDVTLLAQSEVAEVREGGEGRGGSSAMAHKQNPVSAVALVACAERAPGLAATLHSAMLQEHERGAGGWHAEWETLTLLLRLAGSSAAWGRDLFERLEVDTERMRENLAAAAEAGIEDAADPETHLGSAGALVDAILAAHRGDAR
ncbi:MAG TPA: 3-carboxy-cis,cis-muconate cycloisomerase [Thermoleophilaceae bacterium]|nr:3-carboxy-cis,cis-muconate cycloisomerase [Thermoleophilaceae bacterium]